MQLQKFLGNRVVTQTEILAYWNWLMQLQFYLSFHFKACFFGFFYIIFRYGFLFCYVWLNAYFDLLSKRLGVPT